MKQNQAKFFAITWRFVIFFSITLASNTRALSPTNIGSPFPIGIGKIIIGDQMQAPFYLYKNLPITPGITNILLDAANTINSSPAQYGFKLPGTTSFNLNLAQVDLAGQPTFSIAPSLNQNNFYSVNLAYNTAQDASGAIVKRFLTITSAFPANTYAECTLQFNIQQFLQQLAAMKSNDNYSIDFKWVLINLRFDTYGSYLFIDSVDIYLNYLPKRTGLPGGDLLVNIDRNYKQFWKNPNILYSTCQETK